MSGILLTQTSTFLIGPVAKILGYLMEGIFFLLDKIGIPNIGLSIIFFTIVIYMLMMPLTIKQQKFSKLQAKMNPELQAIQKKYKNKKDNDSMMAMNMETKAVYAKYGVSPSGSCVQLLIQMPILFALYRVIYAMPAYVTKIKEAFFPLVDKLIAQADSAAYLQENIQGAAYFSKQFTNENFVNGVTSYVQNTYVDVLNKASTAEFLAIGDKYPSLASDVSQTLTKLDEYNSFLGLNIGNSPSYIIKDAMSSGQYLLIVGALMIPFLAAFTQWLNVKLMPQPATQSNGNSQQDTMMQSMKTMNTMMPLMSAFFCFTLPCGMGLYWVAGAVIRSIQQVVINKKIDKIDFDALIKKNEAKAKKKMEKEGVRAQQLQQYAAMNTKNAAAPASKPKNPSVNKSQDNSDKKVQNYSTKNAKTGSISAKANMVKSYNEKNNK